MPRADSPQYETGHVSVPSGIELFMERGGTRADETAGATADETIVFVNGLTMDTTAWRAMRVFFEDAYGTIAYDCRGQGRSSAPAGPYTPLEHAADLRALLDALELERVHLVGLSNGGLVSMIVAGELAQVDPRRIQSVVTIDSFATVDAMLKLILRSWKAALDAGGPGLRFEVATPWVWGASFLKQHMALLGEFRVRASQAEPRVIHALIDGLLGFSDAKRSLRAYDGPLLAVVGQEDLLTPMRYSHEIVEWARHGMLVTIEQAGHAAPVERPDAVARVVRGFIERRHEFMKPLFGRHGPEDSHDPH